MPAERLGFFIPDKPEYSSPFFSLEIRDPEKLRRNLNQIEKENSSASIVIGPDTGSLVTPPSIYFSTHEPELIIGLRLPRTNDFYTGFIDSGGSLPWGSRKRRWGFERKLRKYVDGELGLLNDNTIVKLNKHTIVRNVAKLPSESNGGAFTYNLQGVLSPLNDSPASQEFFQHYLRKALTIFIIYCTELYKYHEISDQPRKIIIDPRVMQIVFKTERPMSLEKLSPEEKQMIIALAILQPRQTTELQPENDGDTKQEHPDNIIPFPNPRDW